MRRGKISIHGLGTEIVAEVLREGRRKDGGSVAGVVDRFVVWKLA